MAGVNSTLPHIAIRRKHRRRREVTAGGAVLAWSSSRLGMVSERLELGAVNDTTISLP